MLVFGLQSKFLDVDLSVCGGTYSLSNSLKKKVQFHVNTCMPVAES